jgi:DNA-binding NarL/FixJ family response regulator
MPKKDELTARGDTKPRAIVMTTYESEEDIRRALKAGAIRKSGKFSISARTR